MPAKLESLGPRSADCPLRTAVAKAIILPLWGLRGIDQLESFGFWRRKFCIKNAEILSVGKIAEFAKFAGGERRKSPDRCLFNRAERVMDCCLLWLSKKDIEGKRRLTLMRVVST